MFINSLELLLNLNLHECLDDVTLLDVVEVDKADTTLEVGGNLLNIILIALEGVDSTSVDNDTVAHQTGLVCAVYLSFGNHSTSNSTNLGNLEYLAHLNLTCDNLFLNLVEHTLHG